MKIFILVIFCVGFAWGSSVSCKDSAKINPIVEESGSTPVITVMVTSKCTPCDVFRPAFNRLSDQYSSKVHFLEINVDACPLDGPFHANDYPIVVMYKNSNVLEGLKGSEVNADKIEALIKKHTI